MAKGGAKPGERRGGRKKGTPNRTTADARTAFAMLVQDSLPELRGWLTRTGKDDPARALEIVIKLAEYHIPKLARTEVTGRGGGPVKLTTIRPEEAEL